MYLITNLGDSTIQNIYDVSAEAVDAFGQDQVYSPGHSICNHVLKALSTVYRRTAAAFILVDLHQFPRRIAFDPLLEMENLHFKRPQLFFFLSTHTAVGGDAQLGAFAVFIQRDWRRRNYLDTAVALIADDRQTKRIDRSCP